jgi:hypothetical protein
MIGPKRANYILQLRQEAAQDDAASRQEEHGAYFQSIDQLEDIGMKSKDCQTFLKKNLTLLAGLEQKK